MFTIKPYYEKGLGWLFDDPERGIYREPFVGGTPQMIDRILSIKGLPPKKQFSLVFSDQTFLGVDATIDAVGERTYHHAETGMTGWLCIVLRAYFPTSPPQIFVKIEA